MADTKISNLTAITNAELQTTDVIPIVDGSASETKKITIGELDLRWEETTYAAGGNANAVQYTTDGSTFSGDESNFAYNPTDKTLVIGTDSAAGTVGGNALKGGLVVATDDGETSRIAVGLQTSENTTASVGSQMFLARSRGSLASKAIVQNGDALGTIHFVGWDGIDWAPAAKIEVTSSATPGSDDMPGTFKIYTTADGAGSVTERFSIDHAGQVKFNNLNYPTSDGSNGHALITDGAGNLSFSDVGANPAGNDTEIQVNVGGSFGSYSTFVYDDSTTNGTLKISNTAFSTLSNSATQLEIQGAAYAIFTMKENAASRSLRIQVQSPNVEYWCINATAMNYYQAGGKFHTGSNVQYMDISSAGPIGIGASQNGVSGQALTIKGTGATDASSALVVTNSASSTLLEVRDDGLVSFGGLNYPTSDGSDGQVLTTDGAGNIAFEAVPTTTPGGADTQVQFNNSGSFDGSANMVYGVSNVTLTLKGTGTSTTTHSIQAYNSTSSKWLKFRDDGDLFVGDSGAQLWYDSSGATLQVDTVGGGYVYMGSDGSDGYVGGNANLYLRAVSAAGKVYKMAGSTVYSATSSTGTSYYNTTTIPANNRFYIKSSGTSSSTYGFNVVDSASAKNISVRDDGLIEHKPTWKDNIAPFYGATGAGGSSPTFVTWLGGIKAYSFAAGSIEEIFVCWHMNHDVDPGSTFHFHVHWAPDTGGTGGAQVVRWGIEYTIQQGYSVGAFPAPTTVYIEQAASDTANIHQIAEDATGVTSSDFVTDSLIVARIFRDATHANDTYTGEAIGLMADIHYQADKIATINKNPTFF